MIVNGDHRFVEALNLVFVWFYVEGEEGSRSERTVLLTANLLLILVRFQDETNCGRVLAWDDHAGLIHSS